MFSPPINQKALSVLPLRTIQLHACFSTDGDPSSGRFNPPAAEWLPPGVGNGDALQHPISVADFCSRRCGSSSLSRDQAINGNSTAHQQDDRNRSRNQAPSPWRHATLSLSGCRCNRGLRCSRDLSVRTDWCGVGRTRWSCRRSCLRLSSGSGLRRCCRRLLRCRRSRLHCRLRRSRPRCRGDVRTCNGLLRAFAHELPVGKLRDFATVPCINISHTRPLPASQEALNLKVHFWKSFQIEKSIAYHS